MTVESVMPNLYTADVARSVAFYRDVLGGVQTFATPADEPDHVELRLGAVVLAISSREAVVREGLPAPTAGHPLELVIWCDSVDKLVEAVRAAGLPVLVEPAPHASGLRRGYVEDPDGNWLALVSRE